MRKRLLMIFCMFCLFLFISSVARAETLSVPACGFIALGHQAEQLQIDASTAYGKYIYRKDTTEEVFLTPVYLPHGKIIKWIRFHFIDNDPMYAMHCDLVRVNKYTGIAGTIYDLWTSGASSSVRQFTGAFPSVPAWALVNNDVCAYYVVVFFPEGPSGMDRRIYGVTIYYE